MEPGRCYAKCLRPPGAFALDSSMSAIDKEQLKQLERLKSESECPVTYEQGGSWMGIHHFIFKPGTTVELGSDAGYFCRYCGKEQI